jgi:aminopeptidase N
MAQPGIDGCSYSNFDKVQSTHVELNLSVDFDLKTLTGSAVHDLRLLDVGSRTLVLDSRDLIIKNVSGWSGNSDVQVLTFKIQEHNEELGEGIFIDLTPLFDSGILKGQENEEFKVQLDYETSPSSLGLQWLENFQTSGKQDPYLFSQFEPIHARTAIPLQDSPANKITYSAAITVGEPLTALMSAKHEGSSAADGKITYKFKQVR